METEDSTVYKVVSNHEEQYSIWPTHLSTPLGWNEEGKTGTKSECLAYIKEVWTDLRPLSLRKKMKENKTANISKTADESVSFSRGQQADDLIQRLSRSGNPVEVSVAGNNALQAFKESIERGVVHVRFTNTRGGTELRINLDMKASDVRAIGSNHSGDDVHLEGTLSLNGTDTRCIVDVDLRTLNGQGHLST